MDVKAKAPSSSPNVGGSNAQPSRKQDACNRTIPKIDAMVESVECHLGDSLKGSFGEIHMINCTQ